MRLEYFEHWNRLYRWSFQVLNKLLQDQNALQRVYHSVHECDLAELEQVSKSVSTTGSIRLEPYEGRDMSVDVLAYTTTEENKSARITISGGYYFHTMAPDHKSEYSIQLEVLSLFLREVLYLLAVQTLSSSSRAQTGTDSGLISTGTSPAAPTVKLPLPMETARRMVLALDRWAVPPLADSWLHQERRWFACRLCVCRPSVVECPIEVFQGLSDYYHVYRNPEPASQSSKLAEAAKSNDPPLFLRYEGLRFTIMPGVKV